MSGEGWIRTTEGCADRFTVCSLWPLGNLTDGSSWREELNPQQADYKSAALPIELRQQTRGILNKELQGTVNNFFNKEL
jgi:hypothetical protein